MNRRMRRTGTHTRGHAPCVTPRATTPRAHSRAANTGIATPDDEERDVNTTAWKPQGAFDGLDYLIPIPGDPEDDG